ncbi:hypothetical protein COOONC_03829, partial [Cooperia oncophora]
LCLVLCKSVSVEAGAVTTSSPPTTVTFSFKPKTTTESQPAATSSTFSFGAKPFGFAAAAASAAASVDTDEGMDDDGAAGGTSQPTSSLFGGGFMSVFESKRESVNLQWYLDSVQAQMQIRQLFAFARSSNLLKSAGAKQETTSIFSKGGQTSVCTGVRLQCAASSFASAAQKAAQSSPPMTSSVFGAAPKFGGPPVFGGKPVFGSPTQASTAFGGGAATGGGFSAAFPKRTVLRSGARSFDLGSLVIKTCFGGVSPSGGSSLFGGGMSSQTQQKTSSLFGGGQQASRSSTGADIHWSSTRFTLISSCCEIYFVTLKSHVLFGMLCKEFCMEICVKSSWGGI